MSVAVWNCQSWELDVSTRGYIWQLIWVLHLTSDLGCFIWQVPGGYIWALHLKTWPNSAISFKWALIDNIDQWRPLLLALAVSCRGGVYLRMLSKNLNSFQVWLLLHRGLFYERPKNTKGHNIRIYLLLKDFEKTVVHDQSEAMHVADNFLQISIDSLLTEDQDLSIKSVTDTMQ